MRMSHMRRRLFVYAAIHEAAGRNQIRRPNAHGYPLAVRIVSEGHTMHNQSRRWLTVVSLLALLSSTAGCYRMRPSQGGGQAQIATTRSVRPGDIRCRRGTG